MILCDYQIMLMQRYGGVSRCFCELAKYLRKHGEDVKIVALGNQNYYFEKEFGYKFIELKKLDLIYQTF